MLHTHQYQFYPVDSYQNVLLVTDLWQDTCPLGHAHCIFGGTEHYVTIPIGTSEPKYIYLETNEIPNYIHHTHNVHIIDPSGHIYNSVLTLPPQNCPIGHSNCRNNPSSGLGYTSDAAIVATETIVSTEDAIWDGNSHYHKYYTSRSGSYPAVLGFTTCPSGHANCEIMCTGGAPFAGTKTFRTTDSFEGEPPPPLSPPADNTIVKPKVSLEAIRNIEMSTMGRVYVDEQGNFTYESRYARNP